jgi:hypothetical protein
MSAPSWTQMLDNVEQMLAESAAAAEQRAATADSPPAAEGDRAAAWHQFLSQLEQHLGGLQRCTEQATAAAQAADAELAAGQESVRAWRESQAALARKLADGAGPSV